MTYSSLCELITYALRRLHTNPSDWIKIKDYRRSPLFFVMVVQKRTITSLSIPQGIVYHQCEVLHIIKTLVLYIINPIVFDTHLKVWWDTTRFSELMIYTLTRDDIPSLSAWIKKSRSEERDFLVPVAGLEPARCRHRWILSPLRLPIPSHRHMWI